jgi:hypothetical protein
LILPFPGTTNSDPYGIFVFINTIPVFSSVIFNSAERPTTTTLEVPSLFFFSIVRSSSISSLPEALAFKSDSLPVFEAVPPTWKVRKVNCVPGSPID